MAQVSATQTNEAKQDQKADPWSSNEIIQLEELARQLSGENKPVVFQTGIIHLYKMGHIPGAKFAGPASSAEGLEKLRDAAKDISRSSEVVIYCGCCPWNDCPNIRPAYKALNEMGFKKVRVLYIPNNFGQDWTLKGLPVEKGE
ncbi:MAG TPA: rhodanese-like domain-containing protein [Blastocatellia bacterium]|nr:rhodanese-like domain-containing protein [Blastocatellia bacterium]